MQAHSQPANANARNHEQFTHDRTSGFSVMHKKVKIEEMQPTHKTGQALTVPGG